MKNIIIGMSGASGAIYGVRMLEILRDVKSVTTHLIMSSYAKVNIAVETDVSVEYVESIADRVYSNKNQAADISSGSFKAHSMFILPCSVKTLSAITNSYSDSLIVRAADVTLKERRPLVVMPRETPLHVGHCRLLHESSKMGVIICPPMPAFYNRPNSVDDIINHSVSRMLDLIDIDTGMVKRWAGI